MPRHMCARCGSLEWEWKESSGHGRIISWTVTHRPPLPLFKDCVPYATLIVEMDEGVRLVAGVRDLPLDELALDLPLEVDLERVTAEMSVPVFRPSRA